MLCLEEAVMSKQSRTRNKSIAFHVTEDEMYKIDARIKVSGLSRGDYFIRTFLEQEIRTVIGKYECDRLAVELKRLRECIENTNREDLEKVLHECKVLLNELMFYFPVKERNTKDINFDDFNCDDIFSDVEVM